METGPRPRDTLVVPATVAGLLGTTLVAVTAASPALAGRAWGAVGVDHLGARMPEGAARAGMVVGVLLVSLAWLALRPGTRDTTLPGVRILAVWCVPLLAAPPTLSRDAVLYAEVGWTWHLGLDPSVVGVGTHGGPFAAGLDPLWAGMQSVYPPGAVLLSAAASAAVDHDPYLSLVAQRAVPLVSLLVLAALVPRLARLLGAPPDAAVWFALLNPVVVLHVVGGVHSDGAMAALTVAAAWVAVRWPHVALHRWVTAPLLVGLALCVKPQALLAVAAVAALPVRDLVASASAPRAGRLLVGRVLEVAAVALLAVALVSVATGLGLGWLTALAHHPDVVTPRPGVVLRGVVTVGTGLVGTSVDDALAVTDRIVFVTAVVAGVWLVRSRWREPVVLTGGAALLLAVGTDILQPWHLALGLVWLGLARPQRAGHAWLAPCLVAYVVIYAAVTAWPVTDVELALVTVVLGAGWLLLRRGRRPAAVATPPRIGSRDPG